MRSWNHSHQSTGPTPESREEPYPSSLSDRGLHYTQEGNNLSQEEGGGGGGTGEGEGVADGVGSASEERRGSGGGGGGALFVSIIHN